MNHFLSILFCALPSFAAFWCFFAYLLRWNNLSKTQRSFGKLLLFFTLGSMCGFVFQIPYFQDAHRIDWFLSGCASFVPAYYYAFLCNLAGTSRHDKLFVFYLIPVFLVFIDFIINMTMGDEMAGEYMKSVGLADSFDFATLPTICKVKLIFSEWFYRGLLFVQAVIAMGLTYGKIGTFHKDLKEFYADVDSRFSSQCNAIRLFGTLLLVSLGLFFIFRFNFYMSNLWYFAVVDTVLLTSLVAMTVCVLHQTVDAEKLSLISDETRNMGSAIRTGESLLEKLEKSIAEEFYTEPDITIMSLAEQLGTNRTYLSDLIHVTYGLSFSNFVNDLRIKKAVKEMREIPLNTPLTKVAKMCGYANYSQFAHTFAEFAHFTPSEWMKRFR